MIKQSAALFLFLLYSSTVFANTPLENPKHTKHLGNKIELLFFQHAGSGEVFSKAKSECYRLVLRDLDARIIYISNAPARVTGSYSIPEFVKAWQHHESSVHIKPNAILHAKTQDNRWVNDTATFSNIEYNAKEATLAYTLCPLDKNGLEEGKLKAVSLFIDPFHPWPP